MRAPSISSAGRRATRAGTRAFRSRWAERRRPLLAHDEHDEHDAGGKQRQPDDPLQVNALTRDPEQAADERPPGHTSQLAEAAEPPRARRRRATPTRPC